MTNTITYFSQNAPAGQEWLAYAVMPNGQRWMVHSVASSEAEAVQKITELYESEVEKNKPVYVQAIGRGERVSAVEANGRGSHFVGKVWLIHSFTRAKIRVDQSEVDKYISEGWIKGGPRSK